MKLTDLEAKFIRRGDSPGAFRIDDSISGAEGVFFLCPVCFANNGNSNIGVHSVICWSPAVPLDIEPGPGRWELIGTGVADLTLKAGSSSVHLTGAGCGAHFFIRSGEIVPA